ncbi:MAG: amidase, Asp-tRNAAsn/Glu-tRNAGln amidotransferase subunit [Subtercola sp.]|nr:amidase, Asp-tRNAAsn/Glu-tRNAGln amidotransferase subunit [Subtercola sp.]
MRWRPPVPGRPIVPGPPLVPKPGGDANHSAESAAPSDTSTNAPTESTPQPAPDAQPTDPETSLMSDPTGVPADDELLPAADGTAPADAANPADPATNAAPSRPDQLDGVGASAARGQTADVSAPDATAMPPAWLGDPALLAAFWRYERALMTNDITELDELFAAGPLTVRSEAGSALVGHDAIAAFRAGRPPVPQRYLRRVHLRPIDTNTAVIVAESIRGDNGTGSQTQLWQRADEASPWAVTVAHVSTVPGVQFGGQKTLTAVEERAIWATPADRRPLVESDAYPGDGADVGPLAGIRVAVKDLFAIDGETIGAGNPTFAAGRRPETSTAPAVQALIAAGAEITGLAQTDELAFSLAGTNVHYGTPPNAAAPSHISGGSTSGPASAVALGLADLGLGTDTAGSIRVPGSYTGLYGLRTTHNAVSRNGLIGLAPSFDTVGLLARDLSTLTRGVEALLTTGERMPGAPIPPNAAAIPPNGAPIPPNAATAPGSAPGPAGTAARADTASPTPITRILIDPALVTLADPAAQYTFEAAVRALALNSGVSVHNVSAETALAAPDLEQWFDAFRVVQQFEAWAEDGAFVTANPDALDPAIAARFAAASRITEQAAADARATLARATAALEAAVVPGTALALPSTSSPAPHLAADPAEIDRVRAATLRLTCLASLSGLPALTLPYGRVGTLPIGLCLLGSRGADLALLAVARPRT